MGASCLRRAAFFVLVFLLADFLLLCGLTWYSPTTFRFVFSLHIHKSDADDQEVVSDSPGVGASVGKVAQKDIGLNGKANLGYTDIDSMMANAGYEQKKYEHISIMSLNDLDDTAKDRKQYSGVKENTYSKYSKMQFKAVQEKPTFPTTHLRLEGIASSLSPRQANLSHSMRSSGSLRFRPQAVKQGSRDKRLQLDTAESRFLWKAFQPIMTERDRVVMKDILVTFIRTIEDAGLTYMMYGGTLLGSHRHHGLIPWDDDVDLFLRTSEKDTLKEVLSRLEPEYTLYTTQNYRWKFYSSSSSMIKGVKWRYPFLDLCFYFENAKRIWDIDPWYGAKFRYDKSLIFPLVDRPFWNMTLKSPRDTMGSLAKNYNLDMCQTNRYNHKLEQWAKQKTLRVECEKLWDKFPFVFRSDIGDRKVLEILRVGNKTLNSAIVS